MPKSRLLPCSIEASVSLTVLTTPEECLQRPWAFAGPTDQARFFVFSKTEWVHHAMAEEFVRCAAEAIRRHGFFDVVLTGGSTPKRLYSLLAMAPSRDQVDWAKVRVFISDERFVPAGNPLHNWSMIDAALLSQVPIPPDNLFPIDTSASDTTSAAKKYSELLRHTLGNAPQFDLVVAGMGGDGHTASLFPRIRQLGESEPAVAVEAPQHIEPRVERVSLSLDLLRRARRSFFLVAGSDKSPVLREIMADPVRARELYPAAAVAGQNEVNWFVDAEAAGTAEPSASEQAARIK